MVKGRAGDKERFRLHAKGVKMVLAESMRECVHCCNTTMYAWTDSESSFSANRQDIIR